MLIWCCQCNEKVDARLTNGAEIYPHRPDLAALPFWRCDACRNYVGCHHKTGNPTAPLGYIPNKEIRNARQHIHRILDPLWQTGKYKRKELYRMISRLVGFEYHTSKIRNIEEARKIYQVVMQIARDAA